MTAVVLVVCTRCGKHTVPLLHPGIPHICTRCLFPPAQPDPRELVHAGRVQRK